METLHTFEPLSLYEMTLVPCLASAPVVLTAQPLLRARADLADELHGAHFDLRHVAAWDRIPEAVERVVADVVLIDMDGADAFSRGTRGPSGHRLVSLLARQLAARSTALVVMTRLDYAEIEDLARAGISALVPPDVSAKSLAALLWIALERVRGWSVPRATKPRSLPGDDVRPGAASGDSAAPREPVPANDAWRLPDALWWEIAALLPASARASRTRIPDRQVMDALFYVLRTGSAWSALPPEFGSAATIRRRLRAWHDAGVFERLRVLLEEAHRAPSGLNWEQLARVLPQVRRTRVSVR